MSRYFEYPNNHVIFDIQELIIGFATVAGIKEYVYINRAPGYLSYYSIEYKQEYEELFTGDISVNFEDLAMRLSEEYQKDTNTGNDISNVIDKAFSIIKKEISKKYNDRCLDHYQKINDSFITQKRIFDSSTIPLYLVQTLSDFALYDTMDKYDFKRGSIIKNVVTTEGENEISFGIALKYQGEIIDNFYIDVEVDDKKHSFNDFYHLFTETFKQALTELKTCHAEEIWKK